MHATHQERRHAMRDNRKAGEGQCGSDRPSEQNKSRCDRDFEREENHMSADGGSTVN